MRLLATGKLSSSTSFVVSCRCCSGEKLGWEEDQLWDLAVLFSLLRLSIAFIEVEGKKWNFFQLGKKIISARTSLEYLNREDARDLNGDG